MGWAYGTNAEGREVGYGVEAQCDQDGCEAQIDRGLGHVCGAMHDGGEWGCGRYYCAGHLYADGLCEPCGHERAERDDLAIEDSTTILKATVSAMGSVVYRLLHGHPFAEGTWDGVKVEAWAAALPLPQRAALNAALGESYGHGGEGKRAGWDGDHPISGAVLRIANERVGAPLPEDPDNAETKAEDR